MCLGQSVLRAVPCAGAALLSNVESCHSEQAGRQPCHAFSLPAEVAAPVKLTDSWFSVAPHASQEEAILHLPKILNSLLGFFFKSPKGQATGYEHVLYS